MSSHMPNTLYFQCLVFRRKRRKQSFLIAGETQLEVERDGGKTRWKWQGPDRKSAEGNREVQSKRDITLSKTGCYASPPPPTSQFCSLGGQLPLIKILTATLPDSPSSSPPSPPRPPSLCFACHPVTLSLSLSLKTWCFCLLRSTT